MKKFVFRLQTLLNQRQAKEDQLLVELGEVRREAAETERHKVIMLEHLNVITSQRYDAMTSERCDVMTLERYDFYMQSLRDDIKVQELTLEAVRARVEAKRVEVTEAMKERKVIEALRDKQERVYLTAQMRAEQSGLDEMASLRYARGM